MKLQKITFFLTALFFSITCAASNIDSFASKLMDDWLSLQDYYNYFGIGDEIEDEILLKFCKKNNLPYDKGVCASIQKEHAKNPSKFKSLFLGLVQSQMECKSKPKITKLKVTKDDGFYVDSKYSLKCGKNELIVVSIKKAIQGTFGKISIMSVNGNNTQELYKKHLSEYLKKNGHYWIYLDEGK